MPNPVVHFEIHGEDGAKLQKFYGDAFGWKVNADNPMNYGIVEAQDGKGVGGGITVSESAQTMFYIEVADLAASLKSVESLGGRVVMDVTTIPGMVTFAQFADPEGNVVGLVASEVPPAPSS